MAKSQLEIVLIDEGDQSAPTTGPTPEAVASSGSGVPVRDNKAPTAIPTPEHPVSNQRQTSRPEQPAQRQATERRDTTAVEVAGRVAEMTVRAFGLGNLVSEIQRWQQILRDVGGLFRGAAGGRTEAAPVRASAVPQRDDPGQSARPAATSDQPAQPGRRQQTEQPETADHPTFAAVKHFVRVTAPKAFGDFTSGAVDALRTFMGGPDSDDQPIPTAVPNRPQQTAARDDRQQPPIKVHVNQPATSQPLGRKQLPPPLPNWTPPPRPAAPSGIPLPTVTAAPASGPAAPPVIPAAYVPKPPIQPMAAVPATAVPATASAAVPATSAATSVASTAAAAGTVATAAPAAGGVGGVAAVLGPVGIAAVAVAAGFAALLIGSKKLASVLGEAVQNVAGYSAHVSAATAESEVRRERAMIDRGARIGPQMAQFERSRGKMEERVMSMGTDILGLLIQLWNAAEPFLSGAMSVTEAGVAALVLIEKQAELIYDRITLNSEERKRDEKDAAKASEKLAKELKEIFEGEKEGDPLEDEFLESFMNLGGAMAAKLGNPPPGRRRAGRAGP